jgi:hypothetical protein
MGGMIIWGMGAQPRKIQTKIEINNVRAMGLVMSGIVAGPHRPLGTSPKYKNRIQFINQTFTVVFGGG